MQDTNGVAKHLLLGFMVYPMNNYRRCIYNMNARYNYHGGFLSGILILSKAVRFVRNISPLNLLEPETAPWIIIWEICPMISKAVEHRSFSYPVRGGETSEVINSRNPRVKPTFGGATGPREPNSMESYIKRGVERYQVQVQDTVLSPLYSSRPSTPMEQLSWLPASPLETSTFYPGFNPTTKNLLRGSIQVEGHLPLPCDILLEQDIEVSVRDGSRLYVDVYRPPNAKLGSVPTILAFTPFGKQGGPNRYNFDKREWRAGVPRKIVSGLEVFEGPDPAYWCLHGYAVVAAGM
jgi:hypothetical protein